MLRERPFYSRTIPRVRLWTDFTRSCPSPSRPTAPSPRRSAGSGWGAAASSTETSSSAWTRCTTTWRPPTSAWSTASESPTTGPSRTPWLAWGAESGHSTPPLRRRKRGRFLFKARNSISYTKSIWIDREKKRKREIERERKRRNTTRALLACLLFRAAGWKRTPSRLRRCRSGVSHFELVQRQLHYI